MEAQEGSAAASTSSSALHPTDTPLAFLSPVNSVQGHGQPPPGSQGQAYDARGTMRKEVVALLADMANKCLDELGYYYGMPQDLQTLREKLAVAEAHIRATAGFPQQNQELRKQLADAHALINERDEARQIAQLRQQVAIGDQHCKKLFQDNRVLVEAIAKLEGEMKKTGSEREVILRGKVERYRQKRSQLQKELEETRAAIQHRDMELARLSHHCQSLEVFIQANHYGRPMPGVFYGPPPQPMASGMPANPYPHVQPRRVSEPVTSTHPTPMQPPPPSAHPGPQQTRPPPPHPTLQESVQPQAGPSNIRFVHSQHSHLSPPQAAPSNSPNRYPPPPVVLPATSANKPLRFIQQSSPNNSRLGPSPLSASFIPTSNPGIEQRSTVQRGATQPPSNEHGSSGLAASPVVDSKRALSLPIHMTVPLQPEPASSAPQPAPPSPMLDEARSIPELPLENPYPVLGPPAVLQGEVVQSPQATSPLGMKMEEIAPSSPDTKNFIMLSSSPNTTSREQANILASSSPLPQPQPVNASESDTEVSSLPILQDLDVVMGNADDGDSGSDGEEVPVRLGPDGLKLAEDCVADIFDDDDEAGEDIRVCLLCQMRFEQGALDERPAPFVKSSQQELIDHCTNEHPSAWQRLRQPSAD